MANSPHSSHSSDASDARDLTPRDSPGVPAAALRRVVQRAAQLPGSSGATSVVAQDYRARRARRAILADVSSSMLEPAGEACRIDVLTRALSGLWPRGADDAPTLYAFGDAVDVLQRPEAMPSPAGETRLELALARARAEGMRHCIVLTDGEPTHEALALAEADAGSRDLQWRIDVIFCGDASNRAALAFCARLARGGGVHEIVDLTRLGRAAGADTATAQLTAAMRRALPAGTR